VNYETLYNTIQAYAENTEALFVQNIPVFVQQTEDRVYNSVQIPSLRKNVTGNLTAGNQYLSLPTDWLSVYSLAVIDNNTTPNNYLYLLDKDVNFLREAYPSVVYSSPTYQGTPQGLPRFYAVFGSQYSNVNQMTLMLAPTPDKNYIMEMHYYYYPPTIIQGQIATLGTITAGSGYTNGVYQNVSLSGGSGTGATADIQVVGGAVVSVTLTFGGNFYVAGDTLSCTALGSGTNFSIPVATVSNSTGHSWLGDNYDPVLLYGSLREAMIFMKGEQDMVTYYEKMYQEAIQQIIRLGAGLERGDAYRDGMTKLNTNLKGNVVL